MTMRIGVKLPHTGNAAAGPSLAPHARELELAGFDSLWVSDHVVLPTVIESHYPFAADGKATWPTDTPYLEALVALAAAAAVTERVRLGTAALVLPQRNPVLLAKQVASIDALSGGRVALGIGAGWLREEFNALDTPFDTRGARMVEWITLLRECWTGRPAARSGTHYNLPGDTLVLPTPAHAVPLYVGGHSPTALRRAAQLGDGWLAQQAVPDLDPARLADEIATIRSAASAAGRDPSDLQVVLRLVASAGRAGEVARRIGELGRAGVDEIIVDVDPLDGTAAADHDLLRDAASAR
ncbi:TIGR03619 family F420-dependent LLM class oxidoreductase [Actinomadura sp. HBU206391]|uniref:TIGR03619 family F420-dependent LLM class oxidoreductase n=1 Tax=Actinomadura sp. HBU206391 TaxID=2731692 RepID=UPI00164FB447|nr:TIGR03619 family F420-dependent LLM class oxidoreductase [Actinomadura sp. HBU206391]MBC6457878.1 TIGR03619 family F420-dependent LLM class oxidoreductase [Actinomadura sp. HBU206391]